MEHIEILLADDGSTDDSLEICRDYVEKYPESIRVFSCVKNRGVSAARNTLLDNVNGEYLWFLDADDYILPDIIDRVEQIIRKTSCDVLAFDYVKNMKSSKPGCHVTANIFSHDIEGFMRGVFQSRKLYCWLKIIKSEVWPRDLRFPEGRVYEDVEIMPQVLLKADSYYYCAEPFVNYRVRAGSIMSSINRSPEVFDTKKHNDLASAIPNLLLGMRNPKMEEYNTRFILSHFVAREYVKLVKRFRKASKKTDDSSIFAELSDYKRAFETNIPIRFDALLHKYLQRADLLSFAKLWLALRASK